MFRKRERIASFAQNCRISIAKIEGSDYYIAVEPSIYPPGNVVCSLAEFYNYKNPLGILLNVEYFANNLNAYSSFVPLSLDSVDTSRFNPTFGIGLIKASVQKGKIFLKCPGILVKDSGGNVVQHYFGSPNFHNYDGFGLNFRIESPESFLSIQAGTVFPPRSLPSLLRDDGSRKYYLYSSAIPLSELEQTNEGVALRTYSFGNIVFFRGDSATNLSKSPIYVDELSTKND